MKFCFVTHILSHTPWLLFPVIIAFCFSSYSYNVKIKQMTYKQQWNPPGSKWQFLLISNINRKQKQTLEMQEFYAIVAG